ncbi:MAG: hypothetical protein K1W40_13855 [Schaedlerella sp.]|uniref:hypothetical protein n=1 Tax=Schaedlerella sp. TaxID=2676057 RepID=UPI0035275448
MERIKISDRGQFGKAREALKVNGGTFAAFILIFIVCIMGLKPSPSGETFRSTP